MLILYIENYDLNTNKTTIINDTDIKSMDKNDRMFFTINHENPLFSLAYPLKITKIEPKNYQKMNVDFPKNIEIKTIHSSNDDGRIENNQVLDEYDDCQEDLNIGIALIIIYKYVYMYIYVYIYVYIRISSS
jgi:hypothetical protein